MFFHLEKYNQALNAYERAIEIKPENSYFWYWRGRSLEKLQQEQEAEKSYRQALKINPNYELAKEALQTLKNKTKQN